MSQLFSGKDTPIVADINHRTPTKHNAFGGLFI